MIKKSSVTEIGVGSENTTTIYTVPNGKSAEVVMIWITNPDTTNKNLHLEFYNASADATVTLLDDFQVNQKDFIQIGGMANTFVIMKENDKLQAYGSSNSNFKIVASYIEHNDIIQGG